MSRISLFPQEDPLRVSTLVVGCLMLLAAARPAGQASNTQAAATTVLESPLLRLEVTRAPYSYAVIDKRTGQVLVRQAETTFTSGGARRVSAVTIAKASATALEATLTFAESGGGTGRVRWTFA